VALAAVVISAVAILLGYLTVLIGASATVAAWMLALGSTTMMVGLMALGAARQGMRFRDVAFPVVFTFLVVAGSLALALLLPATEGPGSRLLLGLPVRAAIVIYGVGILPMFVLPFYYARTFERLTLAEGDVARFTGAKSPPPAVDGSAERGSVRGGV
jgi:hypothetical protein